MVFNELDLKKIRENLNLTQERLAEMLGVHTRTVQNWESGTKIPESKHALLRKIIDDASNTDEPPTAMPGGNMLNMTGTIPADKLVDLLIAKERSLQESQSQITQLLSIINNITTK